MISGIVCKAKCYLERRRKMPFEVDSCIRGFHIYKDIWSPEVGEVISCERELGNREDPFAVAVKKNSTIVGHLPRTISCLCSLFLRHNGCITCRIYW